MKKILLQFNWISRFLGHLIKILLKDSKQYFLRYNMTWWWSLVTLIKAWSNNFTRWSKENGRILNFLLFWNGKIWTKIPLLGQSVISSQEKKKNSKIFSKCYLWTIKNFKSSIKLKKSRMMEEKMTWLKIKRTISLNQRAG